MLVMRSVACWPFEASVRTLVGEAFHVCFPKWLQVQVRPRMHQSTGPQTWTFSFGIQVD